MKILIDGQEYTPVPVGQWTYEEADHVKRVAGLTVGQVQIGVLTGDALANFAFAVVAFTRTHPDKDPAELRKKAIDDIVVTFADEPKRGRGRRPPARAGAAG